MRPIFTGLTPNAQAEDILMNIALLTMPHRWQQGHSIGELEEAFKKLLGAEHVFSFDSGRTSLFALLKALDLELGSEVLLQAYTCVAVPGPVMWAGLKPVYVDIDSQTLNMSASDLEKKITPKSKVLIIQHTFGFPADLKKLLQIANRKSLFVIEDCAHALGATYEGTQVGSFGDAAFFSFGRDKVISSTFGGMVIVKDKKMADRLAGIHASFKFPKRGWIAKQLGHPSLMGKAKIAYNFFGLGKLQMYIIKKFGFATPAVYSQERSGGKPPFVFHRLANALASAAYKQFRKLEKFNEHRKNIAHLYEVGLPTMTRQTALPETAPIFLRYVIRHPKRDEIMASAKKENIFLGDWYTTAVAPTGVDYQAIGYDPKTCPNAETAASQTLNLPTDIHISEKEVQRIITFLSQWTSKK